MMQSQCQSQGGVSTQLYQVTTVVYTHSLMRERKYPQLEFEGAVFDVRHRSCGGRDTNVILQRLQPDAYPKPTNGGVVFQCPHCQKYMEIVSKGEAYCLHGYGQDPKKINMNYGRCEDCSFVVEFFTASR